MPAIALVDAGAPKQLKKVATLGNYQFSLPADYTGGEAGGTPPGMRSAAWKGAAKAGEQPGIVLFTLFSDAASVKEGGQNMRQSLVNFSAGVTDSMGIKITTREKTEVGRIAGLTFTRFKWAGTTNNQLEVQGINYGVIDNGKVINFIVMGFGSQADSQNKWHESMVATFKKR